MVVGIFDPVSRWDCGVGVSGVLCCMGEERVRWSRVSS